MLEESDCPSPLELKSAPSKKMWIKLRSLLRYMVKQLENGEVNIEELKKNLEYTASLLEAVYIDETRHILDTEDELQELRSDAVPSEVRDWLASTFTQQARAKGRRAEEKPKFRSIVHAVQAGIFVERTACQEIEVLAIVFAAAIHDYEHTGTTNSFHIQTKSECAILYNDRSVLENHHISSVFRLMQDDELNIFINLTKDEFVIDKPKALSLLLHAADISHPTKQWSVHSRWTKALMEEFFRQGDKEAELGLPFSPLCDRTSTLVAQSQIGFIDFIVEPTFSVLTDVAEKSVQPLADEDSKSKNQPRREDVEREGWNEGITNQMSIDELSPCDEEAPPSPAEDEHNQNGNLD
ncbi:hypothetical protein H8958_000812 [Nasalis larvatus]